MNDLFVDCIKGQRRESFERCTSPWRGSLAVLDCVKPTRKPPDLLVAREESSSKCGRFVESSKQRGELFPISPRFIIKFRVRLSQPPVKLIVMPGERLCVGVL